MIKQGVKFSFIFFLLILISLSLVMAENENAQVVEASAVTCDAYFEGYVFDPITGQCNLEGTSGCENPFKYKTKEECEKKELKADNGNDLDACVNKCKAGFKEEGDRSPCIHECKKLYVFDEEKDDLRCLPCGKSCFPSNQVAAMMCPFPVKGEEPKCGVENKECVVLGFEGDGYEVFEDLKKEFKDEEIVGPGITPDSAFYFIDEFFSRFGDEIGNKEEKVSEIKAMIKEGNYEAAQKALEIYKEYAKELEKESDPEKREEARRSAAVIHDALNEIKDSIPEEEQDKFYDEIIKTEKGILTAVEISSKIKVLCIQLAELDPLEYSRMCKTDDDAPEWQMKLDKKLTSEQEKIAKKFVDIMKDCFRTSGEDCKCDDIPFPDFSDACSQAAPLAIACDIKGDERACEKLDSLEMPELPDWLEDIWEELESGMMEAQYDMHMPRECVEAGVTTPKDCGKIMIQTHAPEECKEALLAADVQNEREGREICDKIMMEKHAPKCAEKGITDPEECAKFMDSFRGEDMRGGGGFGGRDCRAIEDSDERLKCYDSAGEYAFNQNFGNKMKHGGGQEEDCIRNCVGDDVRCRGGPDGEENPLCMKCAEKCSKFYEGPCMTEKDWDEKKSECRRLYGESAGDEPIMGDSGQGYECPIDIKCIDFGMPEEDTSNLPEECIRANALSEEACKKHMFDVGAVGPGCGDCSSQCPAGAYTDCVNNRCVCGEVPDTGPQYGPGEGPGEPGDFDNNGEPPSSGGEGGIEESSISSSGSEETSSESSSSNEESSESSGESSGVTGGVISNEFLDYYYS